MTDYATRTLEREASSGDHEAQARLLVERMRAGGLSPARLRIAAYCGSEAAEFAYGREECHKARWRKECTFPGWLQGLLALGADLDVGEREERCPDCVAGVITASDTELAWGMAKWRPCKHCSKECLCKSAYPSRVFVAANGDHITCSGTGITGTGTRRVPWPCSDWLGLRCAIVAGRVAWERVHYAHGWNRNEFPYRDGCGACAEREALDSAQRYHDSGLLVDLEAWRKAWDATEGGTGNNMDWLPHPSVSPAASTREAARESAREAGEDIVRNAICSDLIEWAMS